MKAFDRIWGFENTWKDFLNSFRLSYEPEAPTKPTFGSARLTASYSLTQITNVAIYPPQGTICGAEQWLTTTSLFAKSYRFYPVYMCGPSIGNIRYFLNTMIRWPST